MRNNGYMDKILILALIKFYSKLISRIEKSPILDFGDMSDGITKGQH